MTTAERYEKAILARLEAKSDHNYRWSRWAAAYEAAQAAVVVAEEDQAALRAVLARVRAAVAEHPDPCPEVDSEAGISCGWKRAFQDVRAALEDPA